MNVFLVLLITGAIGLMCLRFWYCAEARSLALNWRQLALGAEVEPPAFDAKMVIDLPAPAQRFFLFTIKPGAPLRTIAQIWMSGELGLGTQAKPNYQPMKGHQLLASPRGFIWKVCTGQGISTVYGSDGFMLGKSWTKCWLFAYLPIVRIVASRDHAMASFGRMLAEAVFWTPAALLPQSGAQWQALADDRARVTITYQGFTQSIDITVAADGRPLTVCFLRWSNANPQKAYQLQSFGGHLSDFAIFEGFQLPTHIEAGNFFGSEQYFPFYKAQIEGIRFVKKPRPCSPN